MMRTGLLALALLFAAAEVAADVVVLVNGDRVTGRVVGPITRRVRVETPYGVLVIPASKVERIRRQDGREEVLNAPPVPDPTPPPPPSPATLEIDITGATFWQAWDPRAAPEDPSLRLEVRLDGRPIASFTDANLDPEDLPRAVVNSFVFSPERLFLGAAEGVTVAPPQRGEGRIRLQLVLPEALAGRRAVALAYQVNDARSTAPLWRDVVVAAGDVTLAPGNLTRARVHQERGSMEYARRSMRNVETFRASFEDGPVAP